MPILGAHKGSWFGLPDFGITEAIGKKIAPKTTNQGQNLSAVFTTPVRAQAPYQPPQYTPAPNQSFQGQTLGANTARSGGGGSYFTPSTNQSIPTNNASDGQYDALREQQEAINRQLEADFNTAMTDLNNQESGLQSQGNSAMGIISNEAAKVGTELASAQSIQQQGVNSSVQTAETGAKTGMQGARDLFRQTQQSNNAQLSALGISSSSVSEALAERLGVETARRIAGITGSLQEIRQNASNELNRINKYFSERSVQVAEDARIKKEQIQQALVQGLNQINSARQQAASAKASARQNLLAQVSSAIASLTQQQQQFDQALKEWAIQKSAALQPIAQDPNYVQNLLAQTQDINKNFATTQFSYQPNFNVRGEATGFSRVTNKEDEEDPLGNPFGN